MNKFFLITTPIIETWDMNKHNTLMLGEWCNTFEKKKFIQNLRNNKILDYHWENNDKVSKDYSNLNYFGDKILDTLVGNLNDFHKEKKSKVYWKIVLSNWLYTFIHILFDRWETIQKAFKDYDIEATRTLNIRNEDMVPQSIENFIQLTHQDKWNHFIYSEIMKKCFSKKIKFEEIYITEKDDEYVKHFEERISLKKKFFFKIYYFSRFLYNKFMGEEKYFIFDTYLGKKNEIDLNLELGNYPLTIAPNFNQFVNPDNHLRKQISISYIPQNDFEDFVIKMIPKLIPCSFLENYQNIKKIFKKYYWPKNPRVIFTSHAINSKTLSSFYIADKKEIGAKLIHGQHGGGYGQCIFHWYEDFEREISDRYITWGWKEDFKTIPLGILKPINDIKKIVKNKKIKSKLLMVIRPKQRYFATALDSKIRGPQIKSYHKDCIDMATDLEKNIRDDCLVIRLHERKYGWSEKEMWKDKLPQVSIDDGFKPIKKILKKSKLVIYTYNSTGYLELMAANFPVLLYWSNEYNPIRSEAKSFFDELKRVGIFHENQKSIREHINKNWDDIESWWNGKELQKVRKNFCDKYAKSIDKKIEKLKPIIFESTN